MPRFDTAAPDHVEVTLSGDLHVITGTEGHASVVINPADPERAKDVEAAEAAEVELVDGRLVVRASEWRRLSNLVIGPKRPAAVDIVLEVPDDVGLTVSAQIASVRVDGQLGRTEIRTQIGSIHLDRTGDVTAKTSGGDVVIGDVAGQARVQGMGTIRIGTVTGPAEVKNITGSVEVGSAEGSLRLRASTGDLAVGKARTDVVARTAGGAITVGSITSGTLDLRTSSGSIQVGVPQGTSVLVDATTKLGRVDQQLADADAPEAGDEHAELRAHTSMGDVVIHRV